MGHRKDDFMKKEFMEIKKLKNGMMYVLRDAVALETVYQVFVNGQEAFRVSCTPEELNELVLGHLYMERYLKVKEQAEEIRIMDEERKIYVKLNKSISEQKNEKKELSKGHFGSWENSFPLEMFAAAEKFFEEPGELFRETGCAHSCALWINGKILFRCEDIGRHNALDKVVGHMLIKDISAEQGAIFTSGRISADYMQKIICSGVKTVVSHSAVTGEAVRLAKEYGITLYGFVRNGRGNLYIG